MACLGIFIVYRSHFFCFQLLRLLLKQLNTFRAPSSPSSSTLVVRVLVSLVSVLLNNWLSFNARLYYNESSYSDGWQQQCCEPVWPFVVEVDDGWPRNIFNEIRCLILLLFFSHFLSFGALSRLVPGPDRIGPDVYYSVFNLSVDNIQAVLCSFLNCFSSASLLCVQVEW